MNLGHFEMVCQVLLLGSLLVVLYAYAGYPLVLWAWSVLPRRRVCCAPATPSVSIVIAAWNEAPRLAARIENCLKQEYPVECLEVVVVSDGSSDDTESVVRRYAPGVVRLVTLATRQGKAVALNEGVARAGGDIIVFADARQQFSSTTVASLAENFSDPSVGAVSGELILESDPESSGAEGVGVYWKLEKWIRRKESEHGSMVGVTGAIYAIRRALFSPLPPGTILDDLLIPMRIAMMGYRVVFEDRAKAYDRVSRKYRDEFARKVRTLAGNYQAMALCPDLLNPWRNPLWFQFMSHKVCRLAAPFMLILLLVTSAVLAAEFPYALVFLAQVAVYSTAFIGWGLIKVGVRERWTSAAYTFCLLNYAALVGAIRFARRDPALWGKTS
ncbi:MAG: glycosyltransferase family 2 protein [Nitrospira sp.]|jgi:biofilm PGA synthesis N-glycosyltransferase PgaC|nr:glycosyltransferase family 2 protein [Nitrospira sp.]